MSYYIFIHYVHFSLNKTIYLRVLNFVSYRPYINGLVKTNERNVVSLDCIAGRNL